MNRFAFVGLLGLGAVLATGQPAQAFWIFHPHGHSHKHGHGRVVPVVPYAPVLPYSPYAPITPGQILSGLQLGYHILQGFGILPGGSLPGQVLRPPAPPPCTVDKSVVDSINRSDATLRDTVTNTNELLKLVRKNDPRLKDIADVPALGTPAGAAGGIGSGL